jgi:hypothetical protein
MVRSRCGAVAVYVALIAAVLFAGALGLCAFETAHDGHGTQGMGVDLCTGLVLVLTSVVLLVSPLSTIAVAVERPVRADVASIHLPDPPPKTASLSFA